MTKYLLAILLLAPSLAHSFAAPVYDTKVDTFNVVGIVCSSGTPVELTRFYNSTGTVGATVIDFGWTELRIRNTTPLSPVYLSENPNVVTSSGAFASGWPLAPYLSQGDSVKIVPKPGMKLYCISAATNATVAVMRSR